MDDNIKELLRYGATFVILIGVFYGGTYLLKGVLGTNYPMMVVVSQSMVPTLGVGDYILIQAVNNFDDIIADDPPYGDILVFKRPGNDDEYIVHRAIEKTYDDRWIYTTKGDNNYSPDGAPVSEDRVIGKVINRVPIVGYFSLFIKTFKGFALVVIMMIMAFFYDYILPKNSEYPQGGRFPSFILAPFGVSVIVLILLWFNPKNHLILEYIALGSWYIGCVLLPLASSDDDSAIMIWLYHLVLLMIPIACDVLWWKYHITPSLWWPIEGSTVPITWLLLLETQTFHQAFIIIMTLLGPGIAGFFLILYGKRQGWESLIDYMKRLRSL